MMAKMLETAMSKAAGLSEAAQEQIGRELIVRIEALEKLRAEVQLGVAQLDEGLGGELDIEDIIGEARRAHAKR